MVGMNAVVPFLPLFIRDLGVESQESTAYWSGLVFAAPFLFSLFLTPLWGSLGDKYGRKIMAIRAIFGLALAQILVGLSQNVYQLLAARTLQGALSGFAPAAIALVSSTVPREKNSYALGLLQTAVSSGSLLGPFLGGLLSDLFGFRAVFFIVGIFIAGTGLLFVQYVERDTPEGTTLNLNYIKGMKETVADVKLRNLLILIALVSFGFAFNRPIFVLYLETFSIKTDYFTTLAGLIYGILGLFATISAPIWGKYAGKNNTSMLLLTAFILVAVNYISHYFITGIWLLVISRSLVGFGYGGILPLLFSGIHSRISPEKTGFIMGIGSSAQILGSFFGPVLCGYLSALYGVRFPFFFSGMVFLIIIILIPDLFNLKKFKQKQI